MNLAGHARQLGLDLAIDRSDTTVILDVELDVSQR
jgi:hypothetical protein